MADKKDEPYHHGDLRTALLDVTAEMIAAEGLDSVTMRALSQRIGVSRTAPYRHFADKAALLAAVAEEGFKRLRTRLEDAAQQTETRDRLLLFQQMGIASIQFAVDHPTHYRLMFNGEIVDPGAYPDLAKTQKSVFDLLVTSIQACQAEDKIKPGEPLALAYTVWATIHGLSSLLIDNQIRNVRSVAELAFATTQALLDGIAV